MSTQLPPEDETSTSTAQMLADALRELVEMFADAFFVSDEVQKARDALAVFDATNEPSSEVRAEAGEAVLDFLAREDVWDSLPEFVVAEIDRICDARDNNPAEIHRMTAERERKIAALRAREAE